MDFSKVRMIISNLRLIQNFSMNNVESGLGRWQIKTMEQTEYYMKNMHADPGYQFLHTIERNKIFEDQAKNSDLN